MYKYARKGEWQMLDKLKALETRFNAVAEMISDAEIIADREKWRDLCREHSELSPIIDEYNLYKGYVNALEEDKDLLEVEEDKELLEMLKSDLAENEKNIKDCEERIKLLLIPKDPNDDKNVIVEIRGGTGGEEAALFAGTLMRMYTMYADSQGWKMDILSSNATELGGYKEISFLIEGKGAYSRLKYESGVHRVQRVPETESGGRIHTSAVTVAVLPEVEEVEFEINRNDLRIDVFRAGGPGGQCVNTTDSAVRITHIPTGVVVSCQTQRSQHQNREYAMRMLKSKLAEIAEQQQKEKIEDIKGVQKEIAWGSQIRSYVFHPYNLVKDHRTNFEMGNIGAVMDGDLNGFINEYLKKASLGQLN